MRRYTLASLEARTGVDLRQYRDVITSIVKEIMPYAVVCVEKDHYTVEPTPSKGDAIRIGRKLSKSAVLGMYCIKISKLFNGTEVEEVN